MALSQHEHGLRLQIRRERQDLRLLVGFAWYKPSDDHLDARGSRPSLHRRHLQQPHRQMAHSGRRSALGGGRILLGSQVVIGALKRAYDALTGGGDYSVTVPPMDGALNPNNRLEEAELIASAPGADNLCLARDKLLFSSEKAVLAI